MTKWGTVVGVFLSLVCMNCPAPAQPAPPHAVAHAQSHAHRHAATHPNRQRNRPIAVTSHSGHVQHGIASVYATQFKGRRMADGTHFDPDSNTAASKTLPLGSTARVTNQKNGKAVQVHVRDRGPYVRGRIIDVSPRNAKDLGMKQNSVAPVTVAPMTSSQQGLRMRFRSPDRA